MVDWAQLTSEEDHRPWPLPGRPWMMTMSWCDLLFAHWSFEPEAIRPLVPAALELDTFEGRAWVGVVPFRMESVGPRGLGWLPARWPRPRSFAELNVRTYVRHRDRPGVWFLSLDAASRLAVEVARAGFHLPYFQAEISAPVSDIGHARVDTVVRREFARLHAAAPPSSCAASGAPEIGLHQREGVAEDARVGLLEAHFLRP